MEVSFSSVFFINLSVLITIAYLFNIGYKYLFPSISGRMKKSISVFVFILAGWLTMLFGLRVGETQLFDLRFVPLIMAILVFTRPSTFVLIGTGIGVGRLMYGLNETSWAGCMNMALLGVFAAAINAFLQAVDWRFVWKTTVAVILINLLNALDVAMMGSIPFSEYWHEVAPITLPLSTLLSGFFVFMIRDFHKEQQRIDELRGMNIILRRQTKELREAKRDLEEKARQLMLASKYKSEFLANMSHELKTPLNSILLMSQLIRDNDDERYGMDEVRYGEIINAAGNELLQLINDILDLSKVEAGKMDIVIEPISPLDLVQMLQAMFQPMADQQSLPFIVEIAEDVPYTMYTDALRVNQIMRNLLVNAFKFTDQGSITLRVAMETLTDTAVTKRRIRDWTSALYRGRPASSQGIIVRSGQTTTGRLRKSVYEAAVAPALSVLKRGEGAAKQEAAAVQESAAARASSTSNQEWQEDSFQPDMYDTARRQRKQENSQQHQEHWLTMSVVDTGIGIDDEKQQLIFEAFQQEDGAVNRKYGGTGLGLSISLQLARLLGGSLSLTSVKGEGSTFTLRLPLQTVSEPEPQTE
ncbi:sensor histidine kinase [Paenibacillus sp. PR3]|uniref:histidine kinase n=1 Tax=Paenibacillus terricola TaxID=2763503 RepID=A0ABR8N1G7_9BACL|nr:ATP-binding protein [Paenibacillus terricola]MBD3921202.1 sensor histidine kinase [Paenibacillus terricola]